MRELGFQTQSGMDNEGVRLVGLNLYRSDGKIFSFYFLFLS